MEADSLPSAPPLPPMQVHDLHAALPEESSSMSLGGDTARPPDVPHNSG